MKMTGLKRVARAGAIVALAVMVGPADVAAQSDEEYESIAPFLGHWDGHISAPDGQDRGNCGGRTGDYGEKLLNCSIPVDNLPLNARAEAWMNYVDIFQSPTTAECATGSLNASLGEDFSLAAAPGRIVTESGQFGERTVWMNGAGPTPLSGDLFQHGHSVGHFEAGDLVIETTHFTFDPDGMDDHLHMATSVRKKVTERYQIIDEDTIRLIITLDDPTFLKRPFRYSKLFTRMPSRSRNAGWRSCDPDVSRRELEFAYPGKKYPDE
jgi:hypothetical protein